MKGNEEETPKIEAQDTADAEIEALLGDYVTANAAQSEVSVSYVADEGANADAPDGVGIYGDYLAEQMSIESNVKKMHIGLKLREDIAAYILAAIYIIFGISFVIFPAQIEEILPYVAGSAMLITSSVQFVAAIITKEYTRTNTNKTASSLILIILGVMVICNPDWGHNIIIVVWGIFGLFEGARAFNHALARISKGMRCSYYIIKAVVELVLAFLLLYDADKYGELHIIVFGISLILDGLTAMPIWKKLFDR